MLTLADADRQASRAAPPGRLGRLTIAAVAVASVYTAATLAPVPSPILSTVFTVAVLALPPAAWLAFAKAPPELRAFTGLLAAAATSWIVGSSIWYAYFLAAGQTVPDPPGVWSIFYFLAYGLAIAGVYAGLRPAILLRRAALDVSVVVAVAIALGGAVVVGFMEIGTGPDPLLAAALPLLGLVVVALVGSAAVGRWEGLPVSVVCFAGGQVLLVAGSLVYGYAEAQGRYDDDRWAGLFWFLGAVASLLAASVIVLRADRPVRRRRPELPAHPGARALAVAAVVALALVAAVAVFARSAGSTPLLLVALVAGTWIGAAMALRAALAVRELEQAYLRLDRAHLEAERARDELVAVNDELAQANVDLQTLNLTFDTLIELIDERTHGGFQALADEAGDDVADLFSRRRMRDEDGAG